MKQELRTLPAGAIKAPFTSVVHRLAALFAVDAAGGGLVITGILQQVALGPDFRR